MGKAGRRKKQRQKERREAQRHGLTVQKLREQKENRRAGRG